MTTLEHRCTSYFSPAIRQRGAVYFFGSRVQVGSVAGQTFEAFVRGTKLYEVTLALQRSTVGHKLLVECDCPYFDGGSLCKHIWAVIKAADQRRWANDQATAGPLELVRHEDFDDEGVWDDYDEADDDEEDDDEEEFVDWESPRQQRLPPRRMAASKPALQLKVVPPEKPAKPSDWQAIFALAQPKMAVKTRLTTTPGGQAPSRPREIRYALDLNASQKNDRLTLALFQRELRASGDWGVVKPFYADHSDLAAAEASLDQRLLALLLGAKRQPKSLHATSYSYQSTKSSLFPVPPSLASLVLAELGRSGRFYLLEPGQERPNDQPLTVMAGEPAAEFTLAVVPDPAGGPAWSVQGRLRWGDVYVPCLDLKAFVCGTLAVFADKVVALVPPPPSQLPWMTKLALSGGVLIPPNELDRFIETLAKMPPVPRLELPAEAGWQQASCVPTVCLSVLSTVNTAQPDWLQARIIFDYQGELVRASDERASWIREDSKTIWCRDTAAEVHAKATLLANPEVVASAGATEVDVSFVASALPRLTEQLTAAGWRVEAQGRMIRQASQFHAFVESGVDWFDLKATCEFDAQKAELPALLRALKEGQSYVRLGDGTVGLLPTEWLRKFSEIAFFGGTKSGLRFTTAQAALLDALLAELPEVEIDERFRELRGRMQAFAGVKARDPSRSFRGQLRDYQREGLGWLDFLAEFGFGGCLADDMGLGKTVQVLAMLHDRIATLRRKKAERRPSLLVVPRSLVYNWKNEAARFAPRLSVLDLATPDRLTRWSEIGQHDLVLTTYALMRADIQRLRKIQFDYCILDEAQAIKTDSALVTKAARLLRADHRLALSGTPVENHLGELGSIFSFLNPGMLSPKLLRSLSSKQPDQAAGTAKLLAKALRPFILRRTKEQVLKDLPAKSEQTIYCELDRQQRKLYSDLRDYYRLKLKKKIASEGVAKSQIAVLEALLRLRQAACHSGLIDKGLKNKPSAKLEALIEQLCDVVGSGHKALVFSQFTSMLALVKTRLEKEKIAFEYLDGSTRDRQARVERFQNDKKVSVFLISLKAGGVGLNLTAADYCFILDPWWNPAAEAQAIDRAHRIGQTKRVFAYRLIAKDTVEEKVVELQERKRDLAKAIVSDDNSHMRGLTLRDVELLLS